MKKCGILIVLLVCNVSLAQLVEGGGSFEASKGAPLGKIKGSFTGNIGSLYSESKKFSYENAHIDGSQYLFKEWENNGSIVIGSKKYILANINFNIDRQEFMSKVENDSVYVYDTNIVDQVTINGKLFKRIYNGIERKNKMYEVVRSGKNFSVVKEYYIKVLEASPNPMLNRPNKKIKQKNKLFVYTASENLVDLKLQKKSVLTFMDKKYNQTIKDFVDKNNLSYKKENDVVRIFNYYDTL